MGKTSTVEKHAFQTEVTQLLHLMIHSLYTNKEIFLRELISNASDACDKLRFEALTDSKLLEDDGPLQVEVDFNEKAKTVTIRDNGIGMNKEDVISNIGTIAQSGTRDFIEKMNAAQKEDKKDKNKNTQEQSDLIGQFGVAFIPLFWWQTMLSW